MSRISSHTERLRSLRPVDRVIPTTSQLRGIADDIYDNVALSTTVRRPEMAGLTGPDIVDIAEAFGKFRSQSLRGSAKAGTQLSEDLGLIAFGLGRDDIKRISSAVNRYREAAAAGRAWNCRKDDPPVAVVQDWAANAPDGLIAEVPDVVVPAGYEPEATGRHIRVSLAALVNTRPSDEEIDRYWARSYAERPKEMTAEHVYLVWWVSHHNLGSVLDDLGAEDLHIASLLVRAHDLLETVLAEARAKMNHLVTGTHDLLRIQEMVEDCSWINEGVFSRVRDAVHAAVENPTERLVALALSRLDVVRRWYTSGAAGLGDIADLNEGHLMHLCRRAGLEVDSGEEKRVREELREKLVELGLRADLDQILPAGLAAWRAGRLPDFLIAVEAKAAGDPTWVALMPTAEVVADVAV